MQQLCASNEGFYRIFGKCMLYGQNEWCDCFKMIGNGTLTLGTLPIHEMNSQNMKGKWGKTITREMAQLFLLKKMLYGQKF